jgi:hypothetical protein
LDGYATGTAGAAGGGGGNGVSNFVVNTKLIQTTLSKIRSTENLCNTTTHFHSIPSIVFPGEFDPERALAWRNTNFALHKAIEVFDHIRAQFQSAYDTCMASCDAGMFTICPVCTLPVVFTIFTESAAFALMLAMDISEHVYAEIVDDQDDAAKDERPSAIYENVITIHGNILTTYYMLSNVLTIVSGIKTKVGARRRLEVIDCTNTTLGYVDNCSKPSCEDPTRYCDGSFNYKYISELESGESYHRTMGHVCIHHLFVSYANSSCLFSP